MNRSVQKAAPPTAEAPGVQAPTPAGPARAKPGRPRGAATKEAKAPPRTNDPERTMADIIDVATHEFSEKGLAGARIDVIAEAMRTSKRMIYY